MRKLLLVIQATFANVCCRRQKLCQLLFANHLLLVASLSKGNSQSFLTNLNYEPVDFYSVFKMITEILQS